MTPIKKPRHSIIIDSLKSPFKNRVKNNYFYNEDPHQEEEEYNKIKLYERGKSQKKFSSTCYFPFNLFFKTSEIET